MNLDVWAVLVRAGMPAWGQYRQHKLTIMRKS